MAGRQPLFLRFQPAFVNRRIVQISCVAFVATTWLLTTGAWAQSRQPDFTGQHVYVSGVANTEWSSLNDDIARLEQGSKQTYYVVVVQSTGSGSSATQRYTDKLYSDWKQQASRQGLTLDPDRAILIVLGIRNRQLSVHAGTELQQKYGLRGQTIDRKIVQPHFIPHARAGNYINGMTVLLQKIEDWIQDIDQRDVRRREAAIARAKKIRQDAAATLTTANQVYTDIQKLIETQADSGLDFSTVATQALQAKNSIDQIQSRVESDSPQALKDATQVQQTLATLRSEIRQMATNQHDAQQQIDKAQQQAGLVAELIEQHSRAGLAVGAAGEKLDRAVAAVRAADAMINSNPRQALQLATAQTSALRMLLEDVKKLPAQREQVEKGFVVLERLHSQVQDQLARVAGLGGNTDDHREAIALLDADIKRAGEQKETDYTTALSLQESARIGLQQHTDDLRAKGDRLYFLSRTLPMWVLAGLATAGLLTLFLLRFRHLRKRNPLLAQLSQFKTKVVDLSDSLDELKERHRMLPYTDEDFKEPMTGETLEIYDSVQKSLETFRQRWLTLMDIWEKAQANLDAEHFFGRAKLIEATKLIDEAPVDDVLHSIREECISTLDRLEDAHEQQQHSEQTLSESLERLTSQIELVRAADLSTEPYEIELRTALDQRDTVADQRVSDPVGTRTVYDSVLNEVRRIGRWTEQIVHHHKGASELAEQLAQVSQSTDEHRQQGYRFCEDGTDPSVLFPKIRHHRSECLNLLNNGEAQTAAEHLSQGFGLIASAKERIERQVQSRRFCAAESALRPQESNRLRQSLGNARQSIVQLVMSFSDDSWHDLADNFELAERAIQESDELIREAATQGSDDVQFYITASEKYRLIQHQQNETAALITAVEQRLADLELLRDRTQQELQSVASLGNSVRRLLASHEADRPAANQRFHHAEIALSRAEGQATATKVDWQDVLDQVDFARSEFEAANSMAQEDIRLASQGANEIAQAEREIRRASSFYQEGFSADASTAISQAKQARSALHALDYEQAIRLANQAVASAREAMRDAENLARAKRRRIERRRREQQTALTIGAASNSSSNFGSSSFGSSGFGSSSSSGSFSSGSSSSSWSSGTSSSSW